MVRVLVALALTLALFNVDVHAYDKEMAKKFNGMFSQFTPEMVAKRPCEVDGKGFFEMIKKKEPFVILDIRTPQEMEIVGITYKDTIRIPMHDLFKEENLNKLPKDKKIIVVCHTGTRAVAAAMALMATGFQNTIYFKGGISSLATESGRNVVGTLW
ncbi:MAG: rhodanese-like domain-containing protein [Thermodesulfovibrionales bacterium]